LSDIREEFKETSKSTAIYSNALIAASSAYERAAAKTERSLQGISNVIATAALPQITALLRILDREARR